MSDYYIGIDTSNYKTSIAAVNDRGGIVSDRSELLDVPAGRRGLRQSEAFFRHSNRLPGYVRGIFEALRSCESFALSDIRAVGVSERPRRQEGSYMPCFLAGLNLAEELGAALDVPVYKFSHQEGHAAAVLPDGYAGKCIFMHLSGGTTEFLLCEPDQAGYDMKISGGTKDISIGQLLDRFGTALGMPFPSGSYLDDAAFEYLFENDRRRPKRSVMPLIRADKGYFNLSGAETRLLRHIEKERISWKAGTDNEAVSTVTAELFLTIAGLLSDSAIYLSRQYDADTVYMAGGVASSRTVRRLLSEDRGIAGAGVKLMFGAPELSGDNAVGTALLCRRVYSAEAAEAE